jgi:hypothetical protein
VRGIAQLYFSISLLLGLTTILSTAVLFFPETSEPRPNLVLPIAFQFGAAMFHFCLGYGMRHLKRWARTASIVVAVIGLFVVPVGTFVGLYLRYVLLGEKGKMVFSPIYKEIIAETPGVKYRTPVLLWIFLAFAIAVFFALIGFTAHEMWTWGR